MNKFLYNIFILPNKKLGALSDVKRTFLILAYFFLWVTFDLTYMHNGGGFMIAFFTLSLYNVLPVFIYTVVLKKTY